MRRFTILTPLDKLARVFMSTPRKYGLLPVRQDFYKAFAAYRVNETDFAGYRYDVKPVRVRPCLSAEDRAGRGQEILCERESFAQSRSTSVRSPDALPSSTPIFC